MKPRLVTSLGLGIAAAGSLPVATQYGLANFYWAAAGTAIVAMGFLIPPRGSALGTTVVGFGITFLAWLDILRGVMDAGAGSDFLAYLLLFLVPVAGFVACAAWWRIGNGRRASANWFGSAFALGAFGGTYWFIHDLVQGYSGFLFADALYAFGFGLASVASFSQRSGLARGRPRSASTA